MFFLGAASSALAQSRLLGKDVERLNIRHETRHYALAGTVSDERLAEFGRCLEYVHAEYARGFAELLGDESQAGRAPASSTDSGSAPPAAPKPSDAEPSNDSDIAWKSKEPYRVVILDTREQYKEFVSAYFKGRAEHSRGLFVAPVRLLLILDDGPTEETYQILFHEAFHQFLHRYVPFASTWVNEGLATYFGTARVRPGGLIFDGPRKDYFQAVRSAASAQALIPLAELMHADATTFYSRRSLARLSFDHTTLSYAQSYTLVGYMLQDAGGREHLRTYLRLLARSGSWQDARRITAEHFPQSLIDALVPVWLAYVNRN